MHGVSVVNNYANMVSACSTTTLTQCQPSQHLCGHHVIIVNNHGDTVSVVNDYSDTCQQQLRRQWDSAVNDTQEIILLLKK